MASPIQFIREQLANSIIDSSKLNDSAVTTDKLNDNAVTADKIDLSNGTYNFGEGSAVLQAATPDQGDNSVKVATTAYVDTAVSDSALSAGQGVDINTGTGVISVDCIGSTGLTFSGAGASALLQIDLSGSTLALGADGIKIADDGVGAAQIADGAVGTVALAALAVTGAKIANETIQPGKLDLTITSGTYNFSSTHIKVATRPSEDDDNFAASTAFVQQEISANLNSAGAGIDITSGLVKVDCIGSTGLTFSAAGNDALLKINSGAGLRIDGSSILKVNFANVGGLQFNGSNELLLKLNSDALALAEAGISVVVDDASIEIDSTDGLRLKDLGISSAKIQDDAVTQAKIADGAVDAARLAANAVTEAKINNSAVTATKIASSAVGTAKIEDLAVNAGKIAANAVTTVKILDSNVTSAKLSFAPRYDEFRATGGAATFTLSNSVDSNLEAGTIVFKNGQRMSFVTGTPSGADEYGISGTTLTFGSNPTAGVSIMVNYWA